MTGRALVLGGGGITGIAWETGLLHGLAEAGIDLADADRVVGTSAGSVVGAQLTTGCELGPLFEHQAQQPRPDAPKAPWAAPSSPGTPSGSRAAGATRGASAA